MRTLFILLAGLLFAGDSTLPNGIRIFELPPSSDSFVVIVGYQAGVRNETSGSSGLAAVVSDYLAATEAARSIALAAYGAGGEVEQLSELDRTALRIRVPLWAAPMILDNVAGYLAATPDKDEALVERTRLSVLQTASEHTTNFREKVEDEVRIGLFGSHPYSHRVPGWAADLDQLEASDVVRFFKDNFGTNHAFVLTTGPMPDALKTRLTAVPQRLSRTLPQSVSRELPAQRTLRFGATETSGAVIMAAPVPGVYYREWYSFLLLDRLVRRVLPENPKTTMALSLDPYYWRLEIPVPAGQFAEMVEDNLLQDVQRLQFARAKPEDFEAARNEARDFLESRYVQEWFASQGIAERRQEGLNWIQSFTADDMRAAVRDLLLANHVTASWSPKVRQTTVDIEPLNSGGSAAAMRKTLGSDAPLSPVKVASFPPHDRPAKAYAPAQQLSSGVWLAASSMPAIFLAGEETSGLPSGVTRLGPNGALWKFDHEPDASIMKAFQKYRAERILIMEPAGSLDRARSLWSGFKANAQDKAAVEPLGKIANIDIPALLVIKAEIDRKLIEAGWWSEASVRIDASQGALLDIDASLEKKTQILSWLKSMATSPLSEADFSWAREAALNQLNDALPDMQSLVWLHDPQYIMEGVEGVAASQVQEAARLYF